MPPSGVRVVALAGGEIDPYVDRLVDLYAVVYRDPPYEEGPKQVEDFRRKLPEETKRPGFSAVLALRDEELLAAAYGWTMPAGGWWSRADAPPPAEMAEDDTFAVMEWIVRPGHRARGHGASVMTALLSARSEPWATLASDPRSEARAIYARNGWRQVGHSALPWGPPMDILVTPLSSG